jgi:hypothetical protein
MAYALTKITAKKICDKYARIYGVNVYKQQRDIKRSNVSLADLQLW